MIWQFARYLIGFFLPLFYKRAQVKNIQNVQVKGPVIIAMNHPNAFTDPIYFTSFSYPTKVSYLARGDAFKPGLASYFLQKLGIIPIFRIQDGGKDGLKKNEDAYRSVNKVLSRNGKMIVFAEGLCIQERRLRPLKKGVARMVFGAYEFLNTDNLMIVPVGVNYSKANKFRSTLFYNVGEPILVKDFIEEYKTNAAKGYNRFLQVLEPKMKGLITHINNKEFDEVVIMIEDLCKKDWIKAQRLNDKNLEHDYLITKQITEKVNTAELNNLEILKEFKDLSKDYFKDLRKNKLRDWLINPNQNQKVNGLNVLLRVFLLVLGFPIYVIGNIGNYLPYKLTENITKKILKGNKEFYSSIALGLGMVIFWLNYILWFFISYVFAPHLLWPILICLMFIASGYFSMHYYFFKLKTLGMLRANNNKALTASLFERRKQLLSLINKF